ncbi:MAG: transposase [Candidatus Tagabacteria bacterium]
MRTVKIIPGEYYHIYNRSVNKQKIFLDERDWIRFLFLILYFQSPINFPQIGRSISYFVKNRAFDIKKEVVDKIIKNRYVELINFCIMPNHFHLTIREIKENGVSQYMQRILTAYTKYFNTKYGRSGHLFQGPFQIVHIKNNEQLLHLSAYIHRNPRELKQWKEKEHQYPWSSYQDYIEENRWNNILKPQIILEQFSNKREYKDFIKTSGTKLELDEKILLE